MARKSEPVDEDLFIERRDIFAKRLGAPEQRPELFRYLADAAVPGFFEWHAWTNRVVEVLCTRKWCGMTGCSSSAKTYNVSGFACLWWLCAPNESSVILCSTTMKSLKKRGWAEVQKFHSAIGGDYGNMVESRTVWQSKQGDEKHAIFGMAVQEGSTTKIADNIKGIHTKRQMVIIDEATSVPAAIWDACTNLYAVPDGGEFILVALGNARTRLDQFGRFIEPENGWDSVSTDLDEWETKPRPEDGEKVLVSVFNFKRSPNVISEHAVSKWLPSKQRVTLRLKALKDRGAENDPLHWSNDLGFPPPEGIAKTVFSESMLEKHRAYDRHVFTGNGFRIIGAFDQARAGGDRPALRFAAMGEIKPGILGIELMPAILLFADASNNEPIAYQLLNQLRNQCANVRYRDQLYSCSPENLAIDCSNEATFGDLCQREWNQNIIRILFGGGASEEPASHEDERPSNVVYRNKRAEMYFKTKSAIESQQLKGLDKDCAAEMVTLEFSDLRPDGTTKPITIQDKGDYKKKFGTSPDLVDCAVMLLEVARIKGFSIAAAGLTINRNQDFEQAVNRSLGVYDDSTYYSPENDAVEDLM